MPKVGLYPFGICHCVYEHIEWVVSVRILNPFYMNAGLEKESLIATKTANSFFVGHCTNRQLCFFWLASLSKLWVYGLVLGLGAVIGNIIGKRFLAGIERGVQFRIMLLMLMVVSGLHYDSQKRKRAVLTSF